MNDWEETTTDLELENMRKPSDKERLLALLSEFGVQPWSESPDDSEVVLTAYHGGVHGYSHFVCIFSFDTDGKFSHVGVWE